MAQAIDAVAHHQAHSAGVIIRPDTLGAVTLLGLNEFFRDQIERVVPGDSLELARPFFSLAPQGMQEALRMMLPLGVTRDLRADHSRGVVVVFRAMHAPDRALVEQFDFERAGRWAIVRTGRIPSPLCLGQTDSLIHRAPIIADQPTLCFLPALLIAARRHRPQEPAPRR